MQHDLQDMNMILSVGYLIETLPGPTKKENQGQIHLHQKGRVKMIQKQKVGTNQGKKFQGTINEGQLKLGQNQEWENHTMK
jgi:hypothetical protein